MISVLTQFIFSLPCPFLLTYHLTSFFLMANHQEEGVGLPGPGREGDLTQADLIGQCSITASSLGNSWAPPLVNSNVTFS